MKQVLFFSFLKPVQSIFIIFIEKKLGDVHQFAFVLQQCVKLTMSLSNKKSKCFIYSIQLKVNKVWRDSILKEMFLFTSVVKTFGFLDWIRLTAVKTSISLSKRNCCRTLYNTMNNAVALWPSLMIEINMYTIAGKNTNAV